MSLKNNALGKRIKEQRKKLNMSQNSLAELIDCEPTHVSYIETGKRNMSLEMFVRVVNALETTADELLQDSLCRFSTVAIHDAETCLSDCSLYESRVILDVMEMTKNSLRTNSCFLVHN